MNGLPIRAFLPACILFVVFSVAFLFLGKQLRSWGFDTDVLMLGNLLVFVISFVSFMMAAKGLTSANHHVFFRMIYGGFLVKLVLLAGAAFIYVMIAKKNVNKPALFFCMGLYLVYTFVEVSKLLKLTRKKPNA